MKLILLSLVAATVLLGQSVIAVEPSSSGLIAAASSPSSEAPTTTSTSLRGGARSALREQTPSKPTAGDFAAVVAGGTRGQKNRQLFETCYYAHRTADDDRIAYVDPDPVVCSTLGDCINEYYCANTDRIAQLAGIYQCGVAWGVFYNGATDCPWEYFCCNYMRGEPTKSRLLHRHYPDKGRLVGY